MSDLATTPQTTSPTSEAPPDVREIWNDLAKWLHKLGEQGRCLFWVAHGVAQGQINTALMQFLVTHLNTKDEELQAVEKSILAACCACPDPVAVAVPNGVRETM